MAVGPNLSTEEELHGARAELLSILRARDPRFLTGVSDAALMQRHREIAETFLKWIGTTGFALEIVALPQLGPNAVEGRWTHNGADFVGFKQPPAAFNRTDATILACAALLRNDWCRARLPDIGERAGSVT